MTDTPSSLPPFGDYVGLGDIAEAFTAIDPDTVLPIGLTDPHSYRGYYHELAVELSGPTRAGDIAAMLKDCIGRTFEGYKGGDFTMHTHSDVYIAQYGYSGGDRIGPVLLHFLTHQTPQKATAATVRWTAELAWLDTITPDDRILSSARTTDNPWHRDLPLPVMHHRQGGNEQLGEIQTVNITDGIVYATGTATGPLADALKAAGADGLKAGIMTVDGTMDYDPGMILRVQDWTIAAVHVGDHMDAFPNARIRIAQKDTP